jgi:hypothetical protein
MHGARSAAEVMSDQTQNPREATLALLAQLLAAQRETNSLLRQLLPPRVASDAELDSPKGDPVTNFDKPFKGSNYKGKKMSECPVDYLNHLVHTFAYYAEKKRAEGDNQKAGYDERSAALARGWAKRLQGSPKQEPEREDW